jgi:hypothetical protein
MHTIDFYMVDAFSDRTFGGNAAAVCPLTEWLPDDVLLKMAQQHNQSETAFFVRNDDGLSCAGLPRSMKSTFWARHACRSPCDFRISGLPRYAD